MALDHLLFNREHFPIETASEEIRGKTVYQFKRVLFLPPYHPSMKNGIDIELAASVVDEALEGTVKDFEKIVKQVPQVQGHLDQVKRDEQGRFVRGHARSHQGGIIIEPLPIMGRLFIGPDCINPYDAFAQGENGITTLTSRRHTGTVQVPMSVQFPPDLLREYEMTDEETIAFIGVRQWSCPNTWHPHNVEAYRTIFYKNLTIALDNAIVTRKYK